jgi:hypothetical protein
MLSAAMRQLVPSKGGRMLSSIATWLWGGGYGNTGAGG